MSLSSGIGLQTLRLTVKIIRLCELIDLDGDGRILSQSSCGRLVNALSTRIVNGVDYFYLGVVRLIDQRLDTLHAVPALRNGDIRL